ncbi:polyhydroxyalkanoic acid system family protein [Qipengyuania sp. 6B39]|uniref:polyhydroxyalkanoic acid system family protein n=1 Tax=Qipengyuania proteolytica TaxID=2867239 RepID=UPI001C8A20E0|nr:polyhydroxyalkanoic acid system family protein [Qipengyuania proteolytica]MBX7497052.1 polyhydroxyalkanoic acid system family protein [Qipengyuania proteolytica]
MRVPIAHDLPKEEVRRRLRSRSHEIANFVPGGMADVTTGWPDEDHMTLSVKAMGQGIDGQVIVEEGQVVFEVNLPPALSFVEPMISKAIRSEGQKMLTDRSGG